MKGEPMMILLVEDDPAHAEIAKRNLRKSGLANDIMHVWDGQEALDYLFRQENYSAPESSPRPHIILLDLRLPKVDGLDVLSRIKADSQLKNIPVVILTTSEAESDLSSAYAQHVNSYLVKPVDFSKFSEQMQLFGFYWLAWNKYPE
jgi:CheY-like chemotaxis protein